MEGRGTPWHSVAVACISECDWMLASFIKLVIFPHESAADRFVAQQYKSNSCTEPELILKKLRACVTTSRFMDFFQWGNANPQTKRAPAVPTIVKKWLLARRGHMVSKESMKRWGMWRYQLQLNLHINQRCDCLKADVLFPCTPHCTLKTLWENDC